MPSLRKLKAIRICFAMLAGIATGCGSAPHDVATSVPLGSRLSQLDRFLIRGTGSEGEVTEWITVGNGSPIPKGSLKNSYGIFRRHSRGDYDGWNASPQARDAFTGEIVFVHDGSTSADANSLTYVKGKLVKAAWGFLPG